MRISDWSSDVCSSDLPPAIIAPVPSHPDLDLARAEGPDQIGGVPAGQPIGVHREDREADVEGQEQHPVAPKIDEGLANAARPLRGAYIPARRLAIEEQQRGDDKPDRAAEEEDDPPGGKARQDRDAVERTCRRSRSEEHTS